MPRPSTKADLLSYGNEKFEIMWSLIDSIPEKQLNTTFQFGDLSAKKEAHWTRDKNLRDVLIHLYEWHQLLLNWVAYNQSGNPTPFLPEPYNWRNYSEMNVMFWEKHQATPYEKAKKLLKESHNIVMQMIEPFSNEELFTKNAFTWTGNSPLGSYCVSSTSSHYDWAIKKIKLHKKTCE